MEKREKKFKVQMTREPLFDFMLHQAYIGITGIFTIIVPIGFVIFIIVMFVSGKISLTYLVGMFFLAIALGLSTPFQINNDAKRELSRNPFYIETITYTVSDRGIATMQKGKKKFFSWKQIIEVHMTKKAVGFFYDKQSVLIMPRKVFEEQELMEFVQANMPAGAIK